MRANIEAVLILKIAAFTNHQISFNAASNEFYKCLEVCLQYVTPEFQKLLLYLMFCSVVVENNLEIHSHACATGFHLGWDGNWNRCHIRAATLMFLKQSGDNSFSLALVTFGVEHHQERMCPYGTKVVMYNGFTPYCWAGSQWQLSKYRVRRWTWCNSACTQGCIWTDWTVLIKHIVQEVAGYYSSKLSLPSVVASTLFIAVLCRRENSTVKDAGRISTQNVLLDRTKTNPNSILNNISNPLCGSILHLLHDSMV